MPDIDSISISDHGASQSPPSAQTRWSGGFSAPTQPGLYIVATPIGNLRDISLRALDILAAADMVLAEDTRQSRKLLDAYQIKTPLTAYHDHNVAKQMPKVIKALGEGKIIAQISDAGTPLISDPGFKLVRAVIKAGLPVYPVPGASAPLAALTIAGLPTDRFLFAGFLPPKSSARQKTLSELGETRATLVFFETAKRLARTLDDIDKVMGGREIVIARELTKKFEQVRRGTAHALADGLKDAPVKGEIVLLIGPPAGNDKWDEDKVDAALAQLVPDLGVKKASAQIAEQSGWPAREVYARAHRLKTDAK